jgi:vanillate O-demethylase ferredoxin subunit
LNLHIGTEGGEFKPDDGRVELQLRVKATTWEAPNILSYDLRAPDGRELPPFTAGAHVDIHLGNGLIRSYSLLNSQAERHRYVIGVQKDAATRGGSKWVHERIRTGELVTISAPRNNFPLVEHATHSILFAGGIGITPIMSMVERLAALGRSWELHYCARTRSNAAFVDRLERRPEVHFNFDGEPGGSVLDLAAIVRSASDQTHFYCCGPLGMLGAFEQATASLAGERVHVEYFSAKEPPAQSGGFTVVLAKSGREIPIPAGKSILDTLLDAGIDIAHSCKEGVCGTCETPVLDGVPDHRDLILTKEEQAANRSMMICCSGAKTERLVLDL